jgi:GNAT superfamily N-acetyltransferase
MTVQCSPLQPQQAERFRMWTFPRYRHLLDLRPSTRQAEDRRPIQPISLLAFENEQPVGLLLGCVPRNEKVPDLDMPNEPEVLSITVAQSRRHQGVASLLVEKFEQAVTAASFSRVRIVYMTGPPEIEFVERLLARRGWSAPKMRMLVLKGPIENFKRAPWYERYSRAEGLEFFPWVQITREDMARLKASHQATHWIANDLVPWFYTMESLEPSSSIGLRYQGEIVGWVINHRIGDDLVRFTCSFIRQDLARRARLLPAYSESMRHAAEAGYRRLMFTVPAHHPAMLNFAERWCAPWSAFIGESRDSFKDLPSLYHLG